MTRVKRGNVARRRRKKILKLAKGFRGAHGVLFRTAKQQVLKALMYSYIGRKHKKRICRRLWIVRINAAVRNYNITYSSFIYKIRKMNIGLNRKILSQLAVLDSHTFYQLINLVK